MEISYIISCHNETTSLNALISLIEKFRCPLDEIIILDDYSDNPETQRIIKEHSGSCKVLQHALDKNYGQHKNFGIENSKGDYIIQFDADELPTEAIIGENLHSIIESNPSIECYGIPRINNFIGITSEIAKRWNWRLSPYQDKQIVNFPDYQLRCFKRDYPRIGFTRRLHEKIEGYREYAFLPAEPDYSILHTKTIETQIETNIRYNEWFTEEENRGHIVK